MTIKPIRSKKEYQAALSRLELIFDAKPGTKAGDELEVLGILIDNYEQEHYPVATRIPLKPLNSVWNN